MKREAEIISLYLIGESPSEKEVGLYEEALMKKGITLNSKEEKLWQLLIRFPFLIGFIDGGLYFIDPTSNIRKKMYIMLAILEASTLHTKYFLSRDFSIFYLIKIMFSSIRGIYRGILGYIFIRMTGYSKI